MTEDRSEARSAGPKRPGERRLAPLPPDEWPSEMAEAMAALRPPSARHAFPARDPSRPKGLNALGMLAHHPALTTAYNHFNGHVLFATTLTPRQRELLVLRVAHLRDCEYEWAQHAVLAADADLSPEEVARVRAGAQDGGWSPLDAALLATVDELVADARITDATWRALSAELDTQQLMDVVFTVGAYDLLAMAFRTFDVDLDDDLRKRYSP
ncbi:MAG TPA: carboxymuconolactone decarboxylase family protein [Acidimicrobiales bacterium]|nr:carboxymuconolactone decarboxylase family protein [Acidimicrobiales bacterium]